MFYGKLRISYIKVIMDESLVKACILNHLNLSKCSNMDALINITLWKNLALLNAQELYKRESYSL